MILADPVRQFLQPPLVARIAVVGPDGYPHVIPIWYALDGDDLVFFSSRTARKVAYIHANPKGAVTVGGEPYGAEGYLLKGDFSVEEDVDHRWLREITYRYEPRPQADEHVTEWGADDYALVVLRFKPNKIIKV